MRRLAIGMFGRLRLLHRALSFWRQYLKLRRAGNNQQTLAFLQALKKLDEPFLVIRQAALVRQHGILDDFAAIAALCEKWEVTLAGGQQLKDDNWRYLAAYVNWWRVVSREKMGLGEASEEDFGPLLCSIDLSKVILHFKEEFPLAIHPNWRR